MIFLCSLILIIFDGLYSYMYYLILSIKILRTGNTFCFLFLTLRPNDNNSPSDPSGNEGVDLIIFEFHNISNIYYNHYNDEYKNFIAFLDSRFHCHHEKLRGQLGRIHIVKLLQRK
jgi:hypothetical protein